MEEKFELEAKVGDLKGERHQLREQVKALEKALDRLRWPPGTDTRRIISGDGADHNRDGGGGAPTDDTLVSHDLSPQGSGRTTTSESGPRMAVSRTRTQQRPPAKTAVSMSTPLSSSTSGVDTSHERSLFHYPKAQHANTESDFNIFTGEPNPRALTPGHDAILRNRGEPTTRMAWVKPVATTTSPSGSPVASPAQSRRALLKSSHWNTHDTTTSNPHYSSATTSIGPRTAARNGQLYPPSASSSSAAATLVRASQYPVQWPSAQQHSPRRIHQGSTTTVASSHASSVANLLHDRLNDITKERDVLRMDITGGYSDSRAQVMLCMVRRFFWRCVLGVVISRINNYTRHINSIGTFILFFFIDTGRTENRGFRRANRRTGVSIKTTMILLMRRGYLDECSTTWLRSNIYMSCLWVYSRLLLFSSHLQRNKYDSMCFADKSRSLLTQWD